MNFENENKKHTTVDVLRNKHFYWPFFRCISLMDLLFIAMRFEMKKKDLKWKKKILNVRMIHTIYRTQCSFGNRYTKFQCKSWMNKRSLWTNALYHIMSNRKANSLTISTLLKWETLLDIEIGVAVAFTTHLQIAHKATNYSRFFFTLFTAYFATTATTTQKKQPIKVAIRRSPNSILPSVSFDRATTNVCNFPIVQKQKVG